MDAPAEHEARAAAPDIDSTSIKARTRGVHHANVGKLLRLALLAPEIVEAVPDGRLPEPVELEELVRPMPSAWGSGGGARAGDCSGP